MLAARAGVVAALCDHFRVGGLKASLLPRANFVALRHSDGTYTRYVHLMHGGVLVQLGQVGVSGKLNFDIIVSTVEENSLKIRTLGHYGYETNSTLVSLFYGFRYYYYCCFC